MCVCVCDYAVYDNDVYPRSEHAAAPGGGNIYGVITLPDHLFLHRHTAGSGGTDEFEPADGTTRASPLPVHRHGNPIGEEGISLIIFTQLFIARPFLGFIVFLGWQQWVAVCSAGRVVVTAATSVSCGSKLYMPNVRARVCTKAAGWRGVK